LGGLGPLRPVPGGPAVALSLWEVYLRYTTSSIGVLNILTLQIHASTCMLYAVPCD